MWFTAYVRLTTHGSRPTAYGLRITAYGLRITAYGLRYYADYCLRLTALPDFGSRVILLRIHGFTTLRIPEGCSLRVAVIGFQSEAVTVSVTL